LIGIFAPGCTWSGADFMGRRKERKEGRKWQILPLDFAQFCRFQVARNGRTDLSKFVTSRRGLGGQHRVFP